MTRKTSIRFAVIPESEVEAIAYVNERGFEPEIERDGQGFVYLVFPALSELECKQLADALPIHLSAKFGIATDIPPPFTSPGGQVN
ncbi:hypothetical protein [Sphingopyxis sp. YR583]|jgi:hypothetical protein|uniref:hypothetical protein n=1 Tax=Sphingopyxis sp. YR583 TaxID=1881047 RepID=UPI000B84C4EF|nr:hypothetical protein [Sphingopyxis sp. YR583]